MNLRYVTPLLHPSSVVQGRHHLEPAQKAYLRRVFADPQPLLCDVSQPPPGCNPDPTPDDLREFTAAAREHIWSAVALDIENAGPHLVCCGAMLFDVEPFACGPGVCFRFRREGGDPWWEDPDDHTEAVFLLDSVLSTPDLLKVGHFCVQHDYPMLLHLGFDLQPPLLDTSALLHSIHAELPKGLQFAATLFCGAPYWKDVKDDKEGDTDREESE